MEILHMPQLSLENRSRAFEELEVIVTVKPAADLFIVTIERERQFYLERKQEGRIKHRKKMMNKRKRHTLDSVDSTLEQEDNCRQMKMFGLLRDLHERTALNHSRLNLIRKH